MIRAYIGLGSNLPGHLTSPIQQVQLALDEIAQSQDIELIQTSSLYRSDPIGPAGQPDYINAACAIDTNLPAEALLDTLQGIEQSHHRVREQHWGPRTLDLDILLYGDQIIDTERLIVPHAFITERGFVLIPLAEISPTLRLPNGKALTELTAKITATGLDKLSCER